ncbi:PIN-like domain-containing protein [Mesorhizobium sp. M0320]|uniref:PIN-like domain-containing protein n=1 Tax=Mesorhizobium sp. M0320 TaxID=2956936 RepID=UPI00333688A2
MRNIFHGYYQPTDAEFKKLWTEGLLVPDNNVLIHLFRFMPKQREEVLAAFKSFGDRLWLPHQVAKEFHDGWRSADSSNRGAYSKLREDLTKKKGEIDDLIRRFSRFDPWPEGSTMNQIASFFDGLSKDIDGATSNLPDADEVFAAVSNLFEGKVAIQPEQKHIDARVKEAERRMQAKIPPGYMDKRPGDYLIWAELKEKAKAVALPILFVTDDRKEDWWLEQSGKTIGPRPELRQEFFSETGQMFYAYPPGRFLSMLRERNQNLISPETVQEMERAELASDLSERLRNRQFLLEEAESVALSAFVDPSSLLRLAWRLSRAISAEAMSTNPATDAELAALQDQISRNAVKLLSHDNDMGEDEYSEFKERSSDWERFMRLTKAISREEFADEVPAVLQVLSRRYNQVRKKRTF